MKLSKSHFTLMSRVEPEFFFLISGKSISLIFVTNIYFNRGKGQYLLDAKIFIEMNSI